MWGFFFRAEPVRSFADAKTSDVARFRRFFHAALERGVYLAPSAFEAAFMSSAHTDRDVDETLDRLRRHGDGVGGMNAPDGARSPSVAVCATASPSRRDAHGPHPPAQRSETLIRVLLSARAPAAPRVCRPSAGSTCSTRRRQPDGARRLGRRVADRA